MAHDRLFLVPRNKSDAALASDLGLAIKEGIDKKDTNDRTMLVTKDKIPLYAGVIFPHPNGRWRVVEVRNAQAQRVAEQQGLFPVEQEELDRIRKMKGQARAPTIPI